MRYTSTVLVTMLLCFYIPGAGQFFAPALEARHLWNWVWQIFPITASIVQHFFALTVAPNTIESDKIRQPRRDLPTIAWSVGILTFFSAGVWLYTCVTSPYKVLDVFIPSSADMFTEPDLSGRMRIFLHPYSYTSGKKMLFYKPFILVPLYLYPSPGSWQPLYSQIASNPGVHFQVIVNPDSGPGVAPGAVPEQNWINTLSKLNSYPNVATVGYVHVLYGKRNETEVTNNIDAYADWAAFRGADIHVDGIFFDEAPAVADADKVAYMNQVSSHARLRFTNPNATRVVFNPGCPVPRVYYDMSDAIVAFEDDQSGYSTQRSQYPMNQIRAPNKHKSIIMVNGFTGSADQQRSLVQGMVANNITGMYVSSNDDYSKFSSLWPQLVAQIGALR
ncbi:hypothetical protein ANO11243_065690 [Dothideomycetidae sp. 11243]|nr:hypothetical protein ANO11243_065690 [fungal sp. No.11243]